MARVFVGNFMLKKTLTITNRLLFSPVKLAVAAHRQLWEKEVWVTWENIKLEEKIIYFIFANHIVAILTLLELLMLKK